jgi:hypothetical protein
VAAQASPKQRNGILRAFFFCILLLIALTVERSSIAAEVPRHLEIARELLQNIKPEDNRYSLGESIITFPQDLFSSRYSMRADCSGFVMALLNRAKYPVQSRMVFLNDNGRRHRYLAEDFVLSIEKEKGFTRVSRVESIQPGDVIAHRMLNAEDKLSSGTTGHVFLVNSTATRIPARAPEIAGTLQYEVGIIDSNREFVGSDDTRLSEPGKPVYGLGAGTIRLYADAESGELVGWARTFKSATKFFSYSARFPSDTKLRVGYIGRPVIADRDR